MSNRRQPQRLPPPITYGSETIDSEVVLHEFPDAFGLLLWKTVRSTRLWTETPEGERSGIFAKDAPRERLALFEAVDVPGDIQAPLSKAAGVLRKRARAATVGSACRSIAMWAEERGAPGTAIEFLQAAAIAMPADAESAHEVGRVARVNGEYQRAETWFRQAISRARRSRDRYEFARSYIGLGNVSILRENYPQAKRALIRGLRAARRFSIRPLVGAAYQELAVLSMRTQSATDAHRFTRAALDSSGRENPGLPRLVYEYGGFLLDAGYFKEALRVIDSVPPTALEPTRRLQRAAAIVQAAAAANEPVAYQEAWTEAERLLEESGQAGAGSALLGLAKGALVAGDPERAQAAAKRARERGVGSGDPSVEQETAALLRAAEGGIRLESGDTRRSSARVRELVEDLTAAMGEPRPA